ILDILGIQNAKNAFLGISLFSTDTPRIENRISAIGGQYIGTDKTPIYEIKDKKIISQIIPLQRLGDNQ
ncbi:MAG: hypothetical protein ACFNXU_02605, partial [Kingella sp. (in: b-proteobacteria)]